MSFDATAIVLPFGFHEWAPVAQAGALGLLTFVEEDAPTVSAALLAATGDLAWQAGFLGCSLGIWIGDALLYLLARGIGRPLLQRAWARRYFNPGAAARSERWFAEKGTWLVLSSRFVPGTRLPTYLAAGFLRLPFGRFLWVSGAGVAVWTIGIFILAKVLGPGLLRWLARWSSGGWAVLAVTVALVLVLRASGKVLLGGALQPASTGDGVGGPAFSFARRPQIGRPSGRKSALLSLRVRAALGRWARWEFWPAWLFYFPVAVNYVRLAIRYRGFTLPTAANPGMFSGGFVGESKIATLRDLQSTSPEFTAEAFLLSAPARQARLGAADRLQCLRQDPDAAAGLLATAVPGSVGRTATLERIFHEHDIEYPFILKPDVGQRGVGVKLIRNREQVVEYLRETNASLVVQRYVPGPHEAGVFYYRFPHDDRGRIFAITEKIFPVITGDGHSTIEELVWRDERARFVAGKHLERLGDRRSEVLGTGETLKLVEAGNHAQGCVFRDGAHLWSGTLEWRLNEISRRLDGFFIGRYDIRYVSEEDLRAGNNFQIIELNGAASEATSIYDARNSLRTAYRVLFRQWELVFAIGAANRRRGCSPTTLPLLWRKWRETTALIETYPMAD